MEEKADFNKYGFALGIKNMKGDLGLGDQDLLCNS
jgi:hypothetical protein